MNKKIVAGVGLLLAVISGLGALSMISMLTEAGTVPNANADTVPIQESSFDINIDPNGVNTARGATDVVLQKITMHNTIDQFRTPGYMRITNFDMVPTGSATATDLGKNLDAVYLYQDGIKVAQGTITASQLQFDTIVLVPLNTTSVITLRGDISSSAKATTLKFTPNFDPFVTIGGADGYLYAAIPLYVKGSPATTSIRLSVPIPSSATFDIALNSDSKTRPYATDGQKNVTLQKMVMKNNAGSQLSSGDIKITGFDIGNIGYDAPKALLCGEGLTGAYLYQDGVKIAQGTINAYDCKITFNKTIHVAAGRTSTVLLTGDISNVDYASHELTFSMNYGSALSSGGIIQATPVRFIGTPSVVYINDPQPELGSDLFKQPDFSLEGGTYANSVSVTMAARGPVYHLPIYYTTDGTEPFFMCAVGNRCIPLGSTKVYALSPLVLTKSTTLKAKTVDPGTGMVSPTSTVTYNILSSAIPTPSLSIGLNQRSVDSVARGATSTRIMYATLTNTGNEDLLVSSVGVGIKGVAGSFGKYVRNTSFYMDGIRSVIMSSTLPTASCSPNFTLKRGYSVSFYVEGDIVSTISQNPLIFSTVSVNGTTSTPLIKATGVTSKKSAKITPAELTSTFELTGSALP